MIPNLAQEHCKYCGKPIAHLELYEMCCPEAHKKAADLEAMERRIADRIDGYDRDDIGQSPDF